MKKLGNLEKVSSRFFRREPRMALVCYGNSVAAIEQETQNFRDCQERRAGTVNQKDHSGCLCIYSHTPLNFLNFLILPYSVVPAIMQQSNLVGGDKEE